jgi:hypothetical protein
MRTLEKGEAKPKLILSWGRMLHKGYDRKGSLAKKKKTLVVILKVLGAKTNWLAVNRQS